MYIYDCVILIHIMKCTVEVRQRGIITIPEAVRNALRIKERDILEIDVDKVGLHEVE